MDNNKTAQARALATIMAKTQAGLGDILKNLDSIMQRIKIQNGQIVQTQKGVKDDNVGVSSSIDAMIGSYSQLGTILNQVKETVTTMQKNSFDINNSLKTLMMQKPPTEDTNDPKKGSGEEPTDTKGTAPSTGPNRPR